MYNSLMIEKHKLFLRAFIILALVGFLNYLAEVFYFHWTLWWYDIILHHLGGACAGTAFLYFYFDFFKLSKFDKIKAVKLTFLFVLFIGVAWEIYELLHHDTSLADGVYYYRDTISDLIADSVGGFFAVIFSFKHFEKISGRI